ncbi:MAG: ABC transporter ATP-binding protein [Pseudomonadales bacterium]|nr:ABC transporter ATP-binding protein [Pseudomonadales bacterium]
MNTLSEPLISTRNIGVSYKLTRSIFSTQKYSALRNVSFDIYRGDSLGIVGRNGAGKSTLLRLLAGIISPDSGVIVSNQSTTALLSLQAGFNGELDGRSNAILNGMLLGFTKPQMMRQINNIIEFSELGNAIYKPVKTYSTGMRARLGFAIAVHMNPEVLLVDEILGVGDAEFREKSTAVMKERLGSEQTVVLVSHQANVIKNLCNRAVWIEDGVTKMEGDAKTVVSSYENYIITNPLAKYNQ